MWTQVCCVGQLVEHKTFRSCLKYHNPEKHKEHLYLIVYEKLGLKDTCLPEQKQEGIVSCWWSTPSTSTYGTWAMLGQSSPVCLWHLCPKSGHFQILKSCKEVRLRIPWGSDVRLGQYPIWRYCSDVRLPSHSSGRDTKSSTFHNSKNCNWERAKQCEDDVDVVSKLVYFKKLLLL